MTLVVLAALRVEAWALRRALPGAVVFRTGMGPRRARRAARAIAGGPWGTVAVAGLAGGLDPALTPGDVVVADEVRPSTGPALPCAGADLLAAALTGRGLPTRVGPIASAARPVAGAARARLAARGALAVDMESGWLAPAAAGRPLAVLRVVVDTPRVELWRVNAVLAGGVRAARTLSRAAPCLGDWSRAVAGAGPDSGTTTLPEVPAPDPKVR